MLKSITIFLSIIFLTKCQNSVYQNEDTPNNRPIIGILTEELTYRLRSIYSHEEYNSYIAASYVKFIEGAGARVVPIRIGKTNEYYQRMLNNINGVLLPGGSALFNKTGGFAEAGAKIYRIAKTMNRRGDYFPIFGICLGFELLTYIAANNEEHRIKCNINREALPLQFKPGYSSSRLFESASNDIIQILISKQVTVNLHKYCVTEEALRRHNLNRSFRIISYNTDKNGIEFISSLEHVTYPFYGLQFHPEKNLYEWKLNLAIPHSFNAVKIGQYFANFFVNEARKNKHSFPLSSLEESELIYNYVPSYTGIKGSDFEQCYLFPQ